MDKIGKIVKKHQDGATINLFVTPGAQAILFPAGFNKWRRCIEIKVRSPANDNKANKEVIKTIADFLDKLGRYDGEFKIREVSFHTRVRIGSELTEDINELVKKGYVEKLKYTSYKLIKHLWE